MDFVKIEKYSDWGTIKYRLLDSTTEINFKDIIRCAIKFPNNVVYDAYLKTKTERYYSSDHGGILDILNDIYGFYLKIHGLDIWINIEDVQVSDYKFSLK